MYKKHRQAFESFNNTFEPELTQKWDKMVADWDANIEKPNPYEETTTGEYFYLCCGWIIANMFDRYNNG